MMIVREEGNLAPLSCCGGFGYISAEPATDLLMRNSVQINDQKEGRFSRKPVYRQARFLSLHVLGSLQPRERRREKEEAPSLLFLGKRGAGGGNLQTLHHIPSNNVRETFVALVVHQTNLFRRIYPQQEAHFALPPVPINHP